MCFISNESVIQPTQIPSEFYIEPNRNLIASITLCSWIGIFLLILIGIYLFKIRKNKKSKKAKIILAVSIVAAILLIIPWAYYKIVMLIG